MSPTARTLAKLRSEGWTAQVVEHWNPFARIRQDLFGVIDVLAIRPGETLGIQATSLSNKSSRIKKLKAHKNSNVWIWAGNGLEVWCWGKKKGKWVVDITEI